jgi:ribonuclease BN (tRNA processing enzyme)
MTFELVVLGVGDTFSDRHHTASLLLRAGGFALAIDCPDSYRRVLARASARAGVPLDLADIDHVLVTHVHGDHVNGLEGVAFYKRFAEGKRVRVVAAPEVRAALWEGRLAAPMARLFDGQRFHDLGFDDYFEHLPLAWDGPTRVGPFTVRARRTIHHVPTSALLVEHGGRVLGYSADTAFDPALIEFLSEADLVIHETNLGPAHTPYEALAALPAELRARMRLIHYPDGLDLSRPAIEPLREGEVIDLARLPGRR